MTTTVELLDAAKLAVGVDSDYGFGQRFGVSRQVVSSWRQKKATFNDDHAAMIAGILRREPGEIMAICAAERAKDEGNRARWLRVAALVAAAVIPPAAGASVDNNAGFAGVSRSNNANYARLRRAVLSALFGRSAAMTVA
jgi:hypothetical protein